MLAWTITRVATQTEDKRHMLSTTRRDSGLRALKTAICFSILAATLILPSCQGSSPEANEYEHFIDQAAEVWRFQGSYLVAVGDSILARGSRGLADITGGRPNTPETKFLIGSMTKSFTAIAALQLAERGLLDLNQTIDHYISDYPSDKSRTITVHHLLCQRSGIPDMVRSREFAMRASRPISPREIVPYFSNEPLGFEPGSRYEYSSSNFVLLGLIIEAVAGMPWEEYVQSHICEPAGMANTDVYNGYIRRPDFAKGCTPDPSGKLVEAPPFYPGAGYAAGALASDVDDLYRLHVALNDTILLSQPYIDLMLTPHSSKYGYGWLVDDFGGHRLTAHSGGTPGFVSVIQRWPDDSVCVIILSNNVAIKAHAIANGLAAIALGEPYEMPVIKAPVTIPPDELAEYAGDYRLASGDTRRIQLDGGRLTAQFASGPARPVLPEGRDIFYFAHDQMTTLSFLRDSSGKIIAHVINQAFDHDTAWCAE